MTKPELEKMIFEILDMASEIVEAADLDGTNYAEYQVPIVTDRLRFIQQRLKVLGYPHS